MGKSLGLLLQDVSRVETPGWLQTDMVHRGFPAGLWVSDLHQLHSIRVHGVVDRVLPLQPFVLSQTSYHYVLSE